MTTPAGKLALGNPNTGEYFVLKYFPTEIEYNRRVNYDLPNTTTGVKRLFYSNTEPHRIPINQLLWDRSDTSHSIESDIRRLLYFQDVDDKLGRPPTLTVIWGDWQETVVLEEVNARLTLFSADGNPIRAYLSITLLGMQEDGTNTSSNIVESDEASEFDPIGNF